MARFEIRVPTYCRPELLARALHSLVTQTETDWLAFVYDDSPHHEAESVVRTLADKRINYRPNSENLGAAGNIDQAFRKQPLSDACFFAILEDDNLLLPHFLKRAREIAESTGYSLIQMNQNIIDENGRPQEPPITTRGDWFSHGPVSPMTLYASLFLMEGVSNGGLVWTRDSKTDLEVGKHMNETCLQEACRTLKITEPVFFESEPCASWSSLPSEKVVRQTGTSRQTSLGQAEIRRYVWAQGTPIIEEVVRFAKSVGREELLNSNLETALRPWDGRGIGKRNWKLRFRGLVRASVTTNPVGPFLASKPGVFRSSTEVVQYVESTSC